MRWASYAALLVTCAPGKALAWNQATTETGQPLHWETECVYYTVASSGSNDIADFETLRDAVSRGFTAWNVDCSALTIMDGGVSDCRKVGFSSDRPSTNLVIWLEDEWPYPSEVGDPFAVTSVYYSPETGEILDADVEFNGVDFVWNTEGRAEQADVWNTMIHEAGHILGLDHSEFAEATMYRFASPGETDKRDLHDDDIAGICAIYPLGADLTPCPGQPGPRALCRGDGSGCSCALPGHHGAAAEGPIRILALVALALALSSGRRGSHPRSGR